MPALHEEKEGEGKYTSLSQYQTIFHLSCMRGKHCIALHEEKEGEGKYTSLSRPVSNYQTITSHASEANTGCFGK